VLITLIFLTGSQLWINHAAISQALFIFKKSFIKGFEIKMDDSIKFETPALMNLPQHTTSFSVNMVDMQHIPIIDPSIDCIHDIIVAIRNV
jgi:hypothetical protein